MLAPAIRVDGLWKTYTIGSRQRHSTLYELLGQRIRRLLSGKATRLADCPLPRQPFLALRDVSFEVPRGEVLGVIGRNGAGKRTLLKILSRIIEPTAGRLSLKGRVASLLEVGTGFHPELTGRDNITLNATILGMGRREIARKFSEIVEFSGVAPFLDTPVKHYSSGMYVRLAFAVAAHVEADILLIDEVLAVGDAEFQKRCLGLMGQVARGGRTVVFVSHNMTALRNLCTQGLLLSDGTVSASGRIDEVLKEYVSGTTARRTGASVDVVDTDPGRVASLHHVAVVSDNRTQTDELCVGTPFSIRVRIAVNEPNVDIGAFVSCLDSSQNCVFTSGSFFTPRLNGARLGPGLHEFLCRVPAHLLNAGDYALDVVVIRDRANVIQRESAVVTFHIHDSRTNIEGWQWPIQGIVRPTLEWSLAPVALPTELAEPAGTLSTH